MTPRATRLRALATRLRDGGDPEAAALVEELAAGEAELLGLLREALDWLDLRWSEGRRMAARIDALTGGARTT